MTELEANIPAESGPPEAATARKNRGIRFSNAEWQEVERLAVEWSISPSELVRQTMFSLINGKLPTWFDGPTAALPPEIQTQIEKIYRGVYVLATLKREELYENGQREKLDAIHEEARITQTEIVEDASGAGN